MERHTGHGTESKLSLLRLQTTLYHSSFYASHAFGLGLRPTNQTTQYDGLVTSHCITLILRGQTIKLLGKSQTRENWGLSARQPPLGLQYSTICSTNNTKHRTQICTLVRLLALSVSRRCSIGIGAHPGQQHRIHGTPDGGTVVMSSDVQVTLRLRAAHDQRRWR